MTYNNSFIHTYTDGGGCHARCQPAHQEHTGVQHLAQGHFDMGNRTSDLQDAGSIPVLQLQCSTEFFPQAAQQAFTPVLT